MGLGLGLGLEVAQAWASDARKGCGAITCGEGGGR